jgi:hypothetical protein
LLALGFGHREGPLLAALPLFAPVAVFSANGRDMDYFEREQIMSDIRIITTTLVYATEAVVTLGANGHLKKKFPILYCPLHSGAKEIKIFGH